MGEITLGTDYEKGSYADSMRLCGFFGIRGPMMYPGRYRMMTYAPLGMGTTCLYFPMKSQYGNYV